MRVTVRGRIDDEKTFILSRRLNALRMAKQAVKKVSFAAERAIKNAMPVDTGRARASWGNWTPQHLRKNAKDASANDAIWETKDDGLTQVQGSNVEYIVYLNDGTSAKAPKSFIDAAAERAQRELENEIDFIMASF
jgi:hypothetical protein